MKKNRQIFTVGDLHGDLKLLSSKHWLEGKSLTKDDILFQLGDFGVIWNDDEGPNEKYWMEWLSNKPWTTIVILGNHEGYDRIEKLPETELYGAKMWEYKGSEHSVYFVKPGEVLTIDDKTFLALPKALSIDKHLRSEGYSWWPQELWSKDEENNALDNLDKIDWKVDYVLSHTCPDSCIYYVIDGVSEKFRDPTARFLEFIANKLEFKEWRFGHFHCEREFTDQSGDKYICQYSNIRELL